MQFDAFFMELLIEPPSVTAAIAIAPPTMARISAYSAAEAPDWSFSMLMKVFISHSFQRPVPPEAQVSRFAFVRREVPNVPSGGLMEPSKNGSRLSPPSAQHS